MGYIIEITENKVNEMSELVEDMLMCGGKLMQCLENMGNGRNRMGRRSPMPDYRDKWNDDEGYDEDRYGERHGGGRRGGGYRY